MRRRIGRVGMAGVRWLRRRHVEGELVQTTELAALGQPLTALQTLCGNSLLLDHRLRAERGMAFEFDLPIAREAANA
jgi:hypothetical protein